MEELFTLYNKYYGQNPERVEAITGSGSARQYYRLQGASGSAIGVIGPDRRENETFIYLSKCLAEAGCKVPVVYEVSDDGGTYIQCDLGDTALFSLLKTDEASALVASVMEQLPRLQLAGNIEQDRLYPVREMRREHVMRDLNYFKYCFLRAVGIEPDEDALDADFEALTAAVLDVPEGLKGWVLRDCQSRNVMIKDGEPWFIDYQAMRRGPLMYDVASFLWQAKAGFSPEFRQEMAECYMNALPANDVSRKQMWRSLNACVWIRTLQVMGAYGLRGLTERKAHFIESIFGALNNVRELLGSDDFSELKELRRCMAALLDLPRFKREPADGRLRVTVYSFSYKKGSYPDDFSGNGGGFMFDCRGLHNPGRYDEYKQLTGRDRPVIEFLERYDEVAEFIKNAEALVFPSIERYVSRGFDSLQIGFGCTGGRHRSVYCAERVAHDIRKHFAADKVDVRLIHRQRNISEIL